MAGFMDRVIDWRDFEAFVGDLYASHSDLDVEHNVAEVGKSGAPRQIDVKFTHRAGGHTYVTLVECKRWKEKVGRDRIDVLAATMKDLNAAKGVMFTTVGYEPGAEAYAKAEGIDLFVVRDLTDEEWGRPGRVVWFWIHYYASQMINISSGSVRFLVLGQAPPKLDLQFQLGLDVLPDPAHTLFSVTDGSAGPNLLELLLHARRRTMALIAREQRAVFDGGAPDAVRGFVVPVELDLSAFPHRELRQEFGRGRLESISMELLVTISQARFEHDRGSGLDLALAVENFMTRQRRVATRGADHGGLATFDLPEGQAPASDDDVLKNGTLMQAFLEAWVRPHSLVQPASRTRPVSFALPSWKPTVPDRAAPADGAASSDTADAA